MEQDPEFLSDIHPPDALFEAVTTGDSVKVEELLNDDEVSTWIERENDGFTALHMAVMYNQTRIIELLLAKGANAQGTAVDGRTPLIMAARNGSVPIVELLLSHGAEPDFLSPQFWFTALWEACSERHLEAARFLIEQGADVDVRNHDGKTPLFCSVAMGDIEITQMLLQKGANKRIRLPDGSTIFDAAAGNEEMLRLLDTDAVLEGPWIAGRKERRKQRAPQSQQLAPPREDDYNKQMACRGFEATLVEFFLGEKEQRIGQSVPVYDLLYGKGPKAILNSARGDKTGDDKPDFTWYHLPCNNMLWVKALITRILAQRNIRLDPSLESELGLSETSKDRISFSRHNCESFKTRLFTSEREEPTETVQVILTPFLHYETYASFLKMHNVLKSAKPWAPDAPGKPASLPNADPGSRVSQKPQSRRPSSRGRRSESRGREQDGDLEKMDISASEDVRQTSRMRSAIRSEIAQDSLAPVPDSGLPDSIREAPRSSFHSRRTRATDRDGISIPGFSERETMSIRPPPPKNLNHYLIRGYLGPLQPRRTLDQYIYSQLDSTKSRDDDQVVFRYTKKIGDSTKIFMVDQLWMWVLGDDTIISCCPLRWDAWINSASQTRNPRSRPPPPGWTSIFAFPERQRTGFHPAAGPRHRPARPMGGPGLAFRNAAVALKARRAKQKAQARMSAGAEGAADWPMLKQEDPLNAHQRVMKYLTDARRQPFSSVYDLASRIASACVNVFDPSQVDEEFQFFEFFERSIGIVQDRATACLKEFRSTLGQFEVWSISVETELVIEVEDILDELNTLKIVLTDQKATIETMNQRTATILTEQGLPKEFHAAAMVDLRVVKGHLVRIEHMEKMAAKANTLLYHLMDLKQKEASLSAAVSAKKQAEETALQGQTIMVFTVVTIIFLPISFMAAFFTIEIDVFPVDDNDKLSLNYVLQYVFGIGFGLSIPFVLIAFNLGTVAEFLKSAKDNIRVPHAGFVIPSFFIIGVFVSVLAGTWASKLASTIKIAVTILVTVLAVISIIAWLIHRLIATARSAVSITTSSGSSSGAG